MARDRKKSAPVKRTSHRFETQSVPPIIDEEESNLLADLINDNEDFEEDDIDDDEEENPPKKISRKEVHHKLVRISDVKVKAAKPVTLTLFTIKSFPFTSDINIDNYDCSIDPINVFVTHSTIIFQNNSIHLEESVPVSISTKLKYYILETNFIQVTAVIHSQSTAIQLHISIDMNMLLQEKVYINSQFLVWCLSGSDNEPSWAVESHYPTAFNVLAFLDRASKQAQTESQLYSNDELDNLMALLKQHGLLTQLRPYQLRGVYWLFQKLTGHNYGPSLKKFHPIDNPASPHLVPPFAAPLNLPSTQPFRPNSTSSNSNSSTTAPTLFYDLLSEELCTEASSKAAADAAVSLEKGIIRGNLLLADEMVSCSLYIHRHDVINTCLLYW